MSKFADKARKAAEQGKVEDMTEEAGGFEYEAPAAGPTTLRFVSYVEIGKRKQKPYQGKEKPDALIALLEFELNHKRHAREIEVDGTKKTVFPTVRVQLPVKKGDRAMYNKLLKAMDYGRGNTHISMMLGEGFVGNVIHNEVVKQVDGKDVKRTYANLRDDNGWTIGAPKANYNTDPLGEPDWRAVQVPEATQPEKMLLWQCPDAEQWASLFIEGTRTVKDDKGNETQKSNNWLQEDIIANATDFEGSPLESLLAEIGGLDLGAVEGPEAAQEEPPFDTDQPPEKSEEPSPAETSGDTGGASDEFDPLAALGM